MTPMRCTKCHTTIDKCACPELDDHLREIMHDPKSPIAVKWCRTCNKHYARCKCETPEFYILQGGKDVTADYTGPKAVRNMLGDRVVPDLTKR